MSKIGIGVSTTPERKELFEKVMRIWNDYKPEGSVLISYNDVTKKGVAYSKNWLLKELEQRGCTDYFLVDNDTWAISKDWYKPFIESPEPHLLYNFPLKSKGKNDMRILYQDDKIVSYSHTRGCFIYVTQKVLDTVGGFDEAYGQAYFEHPDYTNRIHNAGLTTHRSMSPVDANKLIYCIDEDNAIETSIPDDVKRKLWHKNYLLYRKNKTSKEWKPYK